LVATFFLKYHEWENFRIFYEQNPDGVLTREIINEEYGRVNNRDLDGGHAVVLINDNDDKLEFLNSWGTKFADKGFFSIKDENVLDNLKFYDIYWYESDLTQNEIKSY